MADLSQYSNEELRAIAGIKPQQVNSLSQYSDEELAKIAVQDPTEKPFLEKYFPSLFGKEGFTGILNQEATSGLQSMKKAYEEPSARNIGSGMLGALQYVTSPLTAAAKGIVGKPIEEAGKGVGLPEPAAKFVGDLAENAVYMTPYGKIVKEAIAAKQLPGLRGAEVAQKIAGKGSIPLGKEPLKYPAEIQPEMAEKFAAVGQLNKPVVEEGIQNTISKLAPAKFQEILEQKKVVQELTDMARQAGFKEEVIPGIIEKHGINPENIKIVEAESKRVGQKIIDLLHNNDIDFFGVPEILRKHGISPQEFAAELKNTYSTSGRTLARLSYVAKQLKGVMSESPETVQWLNEFTKSMPELTTMDKVMNSIYGAEQFRRSLLVTQFATTARNIASQGTRAGIGAIEDSVQGAINASVGGKGNYVEEIGKGLDMFTAFMSRLSPSGRERLANIIEQNHDALVKMRFYSPAVQETTLTNKVSQVFNVFNNAQEYFFRKMALESKLGQLLKEKGLSLNIDPKEIPQDLLQKAVDYSLEMTFSAMPKSKYAADFVRQWGKNPITTILINPFPRFNFGNALPFLVNYSPYGFLKMLKPSTVADLASGNPEKFAQAASKAMIGTSMLGLALNYRADADQSTKWYEIKVGDRYLDTRAYAPFSTYLFIAEALTHPERLKGTDIASALVGLNRIAGTGLVFTDMIRGKKMEASVDTLTKLAGEYLGSYTVPLRTPKDISTVIDPKEKIIRDTSGEGILAPAMRNIQILNQQLPEAKSPLKTTPMETESPLFRQFTGISTKTKTPLEQEIDRLDIDKSTIYPHTGIPAADRMLAEKMAPIVERLGNRVINSSVYQKMSPTHKEALLSKMLIEPARKEAKRLLVEEYPIMGTIFKYEGQPELIKKLLGEKGIKLNKYTIKKTVKEIEENK